MDFPPEMTATVADASAVIVPSSTRVKASAPDITSSNRLAQVVDGSITNVQPRPDPDVSDSSVSKDDIHLAIGPAELADEDTTSDSEDSDERLEHILNTSDTSTILDSLKINLSPSKDPEIAAEKPEFDFIGKSTEDEATMIDEFPLFPNKIRPTLIIEEEERILRTPEKRGLRDAFDEDSEEGSISKRTRSSALIPHEDQENLSPISRKMQQLQNTKSRIPLPVSQIAVRRSKRLEEPIDTRKICCPKNIEMELRPVLKVKSNCLNYIVDASTGLLFDATKYATEMNSVNGEGIPIPQTPNELVTIPVAKERKASKNPKTAMLRGVAPFKTKSGKANGVVVGFYSEEEYKKFCETDTVVIDKKITTEKKVRWAPELEW